MSSNDKYYTSTRDPIEVLCHHHYFCNYVSFMTVHVNHSRGEGTFRDKKKKSGDSPETGT